MAVSRRVGVAGLCACLALAGCQTASNDPSLLPPLDLSVEPTLPASNEANALGRAQLAAGNAGMAERHFRIAVEADRTDGASWIGLAAAYDNLGRFDLADRAYGRAVALRGETLEILNNRGYSYLLRGDGGRALAMFRRALALDSENAVILNNIRLLQLGQRPVRTTPL